MGNYCIVNKLRTFECKRATRDFFKFAPQMEGESTYVVESHLGVVSLLGVEVIVDEGHSAGSATTELGVEADDGDGFFLGLEHSGKLGLNLSLGNVGELGVDHFDTDLLSSHEGVLEELANVKNELSVCHTAHIY